MQFYDTIIIGGGASGLAAAIMAKNDSRKILIIEHNDRVGKKILSTGNGKCNFTNESCRVVPSGENSDFCFIPNPEGIPPFYSADNSGFAEKVISRFDSEDALKFFRDLGLLPLNKNGYFYPRSEQASSVLDLLRSRVSELGIEVLLGYQPLKISRLKQEDKKNHARFRIDDLYLSRNLILSCGGMNAAKTGSDGSGFELAKQFGHSIVKPLPALCGLKCSDPFFKELAGVRTDAELTLYEGNGKGTPLVKVFGNLQFNSYGISGIPVFQMSLTASRLLDSGKKLLVKINLLPELSEEELQKILSQKHTDKLLGILNKKLANVVIKESLKAHPNEAPEAYDLVYTHMIQKFKVHPVSTLSFEEAQTTSGGVSTREIDPSTMESRKVPGLFFTGEMVDVSGICGGYNLQWAWSTAATAAGAIKNTPVI